jgi:cellulose synthase/poly-beta-1,6-N-acetylglucosamine synthase-like glycosyltransferase
MRWPVVTVIIPARPGLADVPAVAAAQRFDYPSDKLEIIVARGTQPSAQRNAALHAASGELVYFLDDDSIAPPENLRRAVPTFGKPDVAMVGGPNLCPPDAPPLEQAFADVMGSWLAFGPSCARYRPVGVFRATSEKELILCNLLARRAEVIDAGGFDETLYPNEENALMDELAARGRKLIYDPGLIVWRRPRRTLEAFRRMLLNYGRGRAEQFRMHPTPGSLLNFVPPAFVLYLAALPVLWLVSSWTVALFAWYLLAVFIQTLLVPNKRPAHLARVFPLIILTHIGYGLGFWKGLFTDLRRTGAPGNVEVTLERVKGLPE